MQDLADRIRAAEAAGGGRLLSLRRRFNRALTTARVQRARPVRAGGVATTTVRDVPFFLAAEKSRMRPQRGVRGAIGGVRYSPFQPMLDPAALAAHLREQQAAEARDPRHARVRALEGELAALEKRQAALEDRLARARAAVAAYPKTLADMQRELADGTHGPATLAGDICGMLALRDGSVLLAGHNRIYRVDCLEPPTIFTRRSPLPGWDDPDPRVTVVAGNAVPGKNEGHVDGPGPQARFRLAATGVVGMVQLPDESVLVADEGNQCLRRLRCPACAPWSAARCRAQWGQKLDVHLRVKVRDTDGGHRDLRLTARVVRSGSAVFLEAAKLGAQKTQSVVSTDENSLTLEVPGGETAVAVVDQNEKETPLQQPFAFPLVLPRKTDPAELQLERVEDAGGNDALIVRVVTAESAGAGAGAGSGSGAAWEVTTVLKPGTEPYGYDLGVPAGMALLPGDAVAVAVATADGMRVVREEVNAGGEREYSVHHVEGQFGPGSLQGVAVATTAGPGGTQRARLLAADAQRHCVRAWDLTGDGAPTGAPRVVCGRKGQAGRADGHATQEARLDYPVHIAALPDGRVLITTGDDSDNTHRVRVLDMSDEPKVDTVHRADEGPAAPLDAGHGNRLAGFAVMPPAPLGVDVFLATGQEGLLRLTVWDKDGVRDAGRYIAHNMHEAHWNPSTELGRRAAWNRVKSPVWARPARGSKRPRADRDPPAGGSRDDPVVLSGDDED